MPLKHKTSGKLISFEGSEGSGKSTQIARLAAHFQKTQREVVTTREPGGTEIGEQIRNIIVHNSKGDEMCAETELLLFTAARAPLALHSPEEISTALTARPTGRLVQALLDQAAESTDRGWAIQRLETALAAKK